MKVIINLDSIGNQGKAAITTRKEIMYYPLPKQPSVNEVVIKVVDLLSPEGYESYPEYEEAVANAIEKLGYNGIIIKTGIRNAIRERKEYIRPQILKMEKKLAFLKANESRLNDLNRKRYMRLKDLPKEKYNLLLHEEITRILESNFGEEEIKGLMI